MQSGADHGMNPVRADQPVAFRGAAVIEPKDNALADDLETHGAMSQAECARRSRRNRIGQYIQQVRPIHRDVGMTVSLNRYGTEIEGGPRLAGVPHPDLATLRMRRRFHDAGG